MSWNARGLFSLLVACFATSCDNGTESPGGVAGSTNGNAGTGNATGGAGDPSSDSGGATAGSGSLAGGGGGTLAGDSGGASSNGGASSGGTTSTSGGAGGSGGISSSTYTLLFRDDFDTLDLTRWQLMTHSWETNLALFGSESVSVAEGQLVLSLLPAPEGTTDSTGASKSFHGAEVRSVDTLTYGRVRARVKFASGSAVVSSLVTIYTPWPADDWNELDIEILGKAPVSTQFNAMVYMGAPVTPPVTQSVSPTAFPAKVDLGFDPSADYHVFEIEWTPESAKFIVDDAVVHTWTDQIARMKLAQNVLLTIWASSSPEWAGPVTAETGSAKAYYDWIELYRLGP
jgi:beta-glucanase (GH16 family)